MFMFVVALFLGQPVFSENSFDDIYQLNRDKDVIYRSNLAEFQKKLRAEHPVILALFSSQGGRLILYRPGNEPIEAPQVPEEYQILKSVAHSTLALYSYVILENPHWKINLENYLLDNQKALESISDEDMRRVLQNNIVALEAYLKSDSVSLDAIRDYTAKQLPWIQKLMERATHLQVGHWIEVLNAWKKLLGQDFDKTYGVASAVYVTRSRNILYTVLAQFFRESAFNDRLLLLETTDFMISSEAILEELTRIVSDRLIGDLFFGGKFEMDVELLGKAARKALQDHADKLLEPLLLPELKSTDDLGRWPW